MPEGGAGQAKKKTDEVMKMIPGSEAMRALDSYTIDVLGVPSCVLMERAALAIAEAVIAEMKNGTDSRLTLILTGSGNNGGDGFACARILAMKGFPVMIAFAGNRRKLSRDAALELKICEKLGIPMEAVGEYYDRLPESSERELLMRNYLEKQIFLQRPSVIVDALFGIGLSREITGVSEEVIKAVNAYCKEANGQTGEGTVKMRKTAVIAADLASGISADTGAVMGCAVRADVTLAVQCAKPGHFLYPGCEYTGKLKEADIGIAGFEIAGISLTGEQKVFRMPEISDLEALLPKRSRSGNKGTFGKVFIIAGSRNMAGASLLAAKAALRSGAGMVKVLAPEANRLILQTALPEALLSVYENTEEALEEMKSGLDWCDAVVVGPGLGNTPETEALVHALIKSALVKPAVFDADALNVLKGDPSLLSEAAFPVIVTPHIGEMARLTGKSAGSIKADPAGCAESFYHEYGVSCVLKDARTVIASAKGLFLNPSGNDGMATAGSGDVLAGLLGGLLARGTDPDTAGALGAFIHGLAGDAAASRLGKSFLGASDIIDELKAFC